MVRLARQAGNKLRLRAVSERRTVFSCRFQPGRQDRPLHVAPDGKMG